ncbi:MAG: hypothetical protein RLY21_1070 [Planctomycetota bacterium]|jgi:hypothetical protein
MVAARISTLALAAASLGILAAGLGACASRRTDAAGAAPTKPSPQTDGVVAPIEPALPTEPPARHTASAIAISDLSRVERDLRRRPLIEVRIDASDASGAPARLGGAMRMVVEAPGAVPESQTFDLPIASQKQSDERYDPILRQYVMRIEPVWSTEPARGSTIEVRASLTLVSGSTLEAVGSIEW